MPDDIDAFIERIVEAAQIPSRQRRDELRRELRSHFEDSGPTPVAGFRACRRLRHRPDIRARRGSRGDSCAVRVVEGARVARWLRPRICVRVAGERERVGAFVTAGILATIGVGVPRATTAWTARALVTLTAFTVVEYLLHQSLGIAFGPIRALAAGTTLLMLWASTIVIVAFSDRAFGRVFRTT